MLTLESFKLLNPKVSRFQRGSGGTPDLTFQEVADVLAQMSRPAAAWARLRYADERKWSCQVLRFLRHRLERDGEDVEECYWMRMTRLTLICAVTENPLTNRRKAKVAGVRWWTKNNERDLHKCLFLLDGLDYEVRSHLKAWNEHRSVGDF